MINDLPFILALILVAISAVYAAVLSGFIRGMMRLKQNRPIEPEIWPSLSVILPARNEAAVLERTLRSLCQQDYPGEWEIIVVDDRSTDDTPRILTDLATVIPRLRSIRITEMHPRSPKKNALATGIRASRGSVIVTTDADCTYHRSWLRGMISHMTPEVGVVAGLTVFELPGTHVPIWQKIQWLDFLVQQFLAAGAVGRGVPSSCNGSNLAYRKQVYDEISGFGASTRQVSGDDVLFAQRVSRLTKWKTVFSTLPETIVCSLPVLTVRELLHQRLRWASKGLAYRRSMSLFLLGIYLYYLLWLATPLLVVLRPALLPMILLMAAWKLAWDYRTVQIGCRLFGQTSMLRYFLPYAVLHVIFSPIFGFLGPLLAFRWKNEWYRTARLPRPLRYRRLLHTRRIARQRRAAETAL